MHFVSTLFCQAIVMKSLKSKIGAVFDSDDQDFIDNNLLKVEVFFSDFTYEDIAESPGYSVSKCNDLYNQ